MSLENRPAKPAVIVSVNPKSGATSRSELINDMEQKLTDAGFKPLILSSIDDVYAQSKRLHEAGQLRTVVAAGGDGTVSLLANTLEPGIPLAIFPLGTENLLAKYLDLTADPDRLVSLLLHGREKKLDAGRANGKLFLVMASCGFDASVVEKLHSNRRGHINHFSYLHPILSTIRRYRYPRLSITIEDEPEPLSCSWLFLFNVSRYAMNLPIVPEADPCDGQLNMCSFRQGGTLRGLFYLATVLLRKHRHWCTTEFRKFRKMRITCDDPNASVPFQLDGDPGGHLPLEIETVSDYLTVLIPTETTNGVS